MDSPRASQGAQTTLATSGAEPSAAREWYDHWRERPDRIGRTRDWKDCAHCAHKSVYRGMGVRVCAFQAQPEDCGRYAYKFHPWLRADCLMWCHDPTPEVYDALGLPVARERSETVAATGLEADPGCKKDPSNG